MIIVLKQSGTLPLAKLVKISSTEQEKEKRKSYVMHHGQHLVH